MTHSKTVSMLLAAALAGALAATAAAAPLVDAPVALDDGKAPPPVARVVERTRATSRP